MEGREEGGWKEKEKGKKRVGRGKGRLKRNRIGRLIKCGQEKKRLMGQ